MQELHVESTESMMQGIYMCVCVCVYIICLDNENTDFETSTEVEQELYEESSENTIQGILPFQSMHTHIYTTKHVNSYPCLYIVYVNKTNILSLQYM